jgi:hypothetical protein
MGNKISFYQLIVYQTLLKSVFRFHNENLQAKTPLSSRWLKEQIQRQTTVPAIATTRWKQYQIPPELKTKKNY